MSLESFFQNCTHPRRVTSELLVTISRWTLTLITQDFRPFSYRVQHQFNIKPFNVQSNVMTKSWTTSSIASAVETRNEEDTTMFQSRDLIREYLLKTRVPEILKPQQSRRFSPLPNFATSTMSDMNLAYKHPLVIAEELKNDGGEGLAWAESSIGRKLPSAPDNSSIIVPRKIQQRKKSIEDRPHLIRKVTPSIAKTWEQLTSTMERSMNESEASDDDDDKQSYVLFVRNPYNFQQSNDDFAVNKINHEPSEKFYDSIDNVDDYYPDYEDDEVTSGTETEAGEMMAEELDSLEMRCNDVIVWSIES